MQGPSKILKMHLTTMAYISMMAKERLQKLCKLAAGIAKTINLLCYETIQRGQENM